MCLGYYSTIIKGQAVARNRLISNLSYKIQNWYQNNSYIGNEKKMKENARLTLAQNSSAIGSKMSYPRT